MVDSAQDLRNRIAHIDKQLETPPQQSASDVERWRARLLAQRAVYSQALERIESKEIEPSEVSPESIGQASLIVAGQQLGIIEESRRAGIREKATEEKIKRFERGTATEQDISYLERKGFLKREEREIPRRVPLQPTPTEEALGMSLPSNLRYLSVEEVKRKQSLPQEYATKIFAREEPLRKEYSPFLEREVLAPQTRITGYETTLQRTVPSELLVFKSPFEETKFATRIRQILPEKPFGLDIEGRLGYLSRREQKLFQEGYSPLSGQIQFPRYEAFGLGAYKGLREQPTKAAISAGLFFAVPPVLKVAGRGAQALGILKLARAFPKTTKFLGITTGLGLVGTYGYNVYKRIKLKPTPIREAAEFGGITTTEIIPSSVGFKAGKYVTERGVGYLRTFGKEFITPESIIEKEILEGTKTFPVLRRGQTAKQLQKEFLISKYRLPKQKRIGVYTASPETFARKTELRKGTSELPGLYTAPSLSAYFLKLQKTPSEYYSFNVFDLFTGGTPTAILTYPKGVKLMPGVKPSRKTLIPSSYRKRFTRFLEEDALKGRAYIPFMKSEKEAIIPAGTEVKRIGSRYYTKVRGVRVPIYEYEPIGIKKTFKPKKGKVGTIREVVDYYKYSRKSSYPLASYSFKIPSKVSPLSSLLTSRLSKVSRVSSKISRTSDPYRTISKISYRPSFKTPPYYPPRYPPYRTPPYPLYRPPKIPAYYPSRISPPRISPFRRTYDYNPYKKIPGIKPFKIKPEKGLTPSLVSVTTPITGKLKQDPTGLGIRKYPRGLRNPYTELQQQISNIFGTVRTKRGRKKKRR